MPAPTAADTSVPSVAASEIRSVFLGVNPRTETTAEHSDHARTNWWRYSLTSFNPSLLQAEVPTCFKKSPIIPVPKKAHTTCLNDYRPIALTSIIIKCFKRLIMAHISSSLPVYLDPLQFACRHNRSTEDVISLALHSFLEHLDNKDIYIRLLLVDCSSIFNTIIASRLISKLRELGLSSSICNWILSFLTCRPMVRI
eukprot:g45876.t1